MDGADVLMQLIIGEIACGASGCIGVRVRSVCGRGWSVWTVVVVWVGCVVICYGWMGG